MRSIAEALDGMLEAFQVLGTKTVALPAAAGRHVAQDVMASFDSPPFDNSAMDGYAVRSGEVTGASVDTPVTLRVRGESRAGGEIPDALEAGTACRIFTGATMPAGADAVVIQEDTSRDGDDVRIIEASFEGRHVRAQGSDVRRGAILVRAGGKLEAGEIGLLASQNVGTVEVFRQPRVALLSTGDELEALGGSLGPGKIINSNLYVLAEMVRSVGAVPVPMPSARDDVASIEASLREALTADVVITMGGVSVGEYDFVHEAFKRVGIEPEFWKVRIKPGKPLTFAQHQGTPVIGLPGNPISAMVTFEVLVTPCLRRMLGDPEPHPQPIQARLTHAYAKRPGRVEIARAVARRQGGEVTVTLKHLQGSGSLPSFVGVNALVILPSDRGDFGPNDMVETLLWGRGLRADATFFEGIT
ncbi:MAG: gephyrin-like molybdotransferase Glp [Myxococcota bacterium]